MLGLTLAYHPLCLSQMGLAERGKMLPLELSWRGVKAAHRVWKPGGVEAEQCAVCGMG